MHKNRPIPWTTDDILEATGGRLLSGRPDSGFTGIGIDSRAIKPDELFVAIAGETHDGHSFVDAVLKGGVRGLLVHGKKSGSILSGAVPPGTAVIGVPDTTRALGDLAAYNRRRADVSVVGLTGSNGKTSTRSMLSRVAANRYDTLSTMGNFNNKIGLPLTLLKLEKRHDWVVLEMGMNRPGEIHRLAEICSPDIGMITNVGPAHLEGLGSLEGVARAKGELLEKLGPGGKTILNADDPNVRSLSDRAPGDILFFGQSRDAAVRAGSIREFENRVSFELEIPGGLEEVILDTPGRFMVSNALAAAAAGYLMGIGIRNIKKGLESFTAVKGRLVVRTLATGIRVIDDTYNANPASMAAALETLHHLKGEGRSVVVVGDMLELGNQAAALHRELGSRIADMSPVRLCATGDMADSTLQGAREGGMADGQIMCGSHEELALDLIDRIEPGDWILVKGSRGMRMERIVKKLIETFGER